MEKQTRELYDSLSIENKTSLAQNPQIPKWLFAELCTEESWKILESVAKNPNTPSDVLDRLANSKYKYIREQVAHHPHTSLEVLIDLAKDSKTNTDIRFGLVSNPNTPSEGLKEVIKDQDYFVRLNAAKHPNATEQILVTVFEQERKRKYPKEEVLENIVKNVNCPGYLKAVIQTMLKER
jgi:hypothetical protein